MHDQEPWSEGRVERDWNPAGGPWTHGPRGGPSAQWGQQQWRPADPRPDRGWDAPRQQRRAGWDERRHLGGHEPGGDYGRRISPGWNEAAPRGGWDERGRYDAPEWSGGRGRREEEWGAPPGPPRDYPQQARPPRYGPPGGPYGSRGHWGEQRYDEERGAYGLGAPGRREGGYGPAPGPQRGGGTFGRPLRESPAFNEPPRYSQHDWHREGDIEREVEEVAPDWSPTTYHLEEPLASEGRARESFGDPRSRERRRGSEEQRFQEWAGGTPREGDWQRLRAPREAEHEQWETDWSREHDRWTRMSNPATGWGPQTGQVAGVRWSYTEIQITPGPHSGRGPKHYQRSDDAIHDEVCQRLSHHGQLDASEIDVVVENGAVRLEGTVPNRDAKRMAEEALASISGIKDIHNRLRTGDDQSGSPTENRTETESVARTRRSKSSGKAKQAGETGEGKLGDSGENVKS